MAKVDAILEGKKTGFQLENSNANNHQKIIFPSNQNRENKIRQIPDNRDCL